MGWKHNKKTGGLFWSEEESYEVRRDRQNRETERAMAEMQEIGYKNREEVLSNFIDADDYSNKSQYKDLTNRNTQIGKQIGQIDMEQKRLKDLLVKETTRKPESEYDIKDRTAKLLGETPMKYTDAGKRILKELDSLQKTKTLLEKEESNILHKQEKNDYAYARAEERDWESIRPSYTTGDPFKEYKGFITHTRTGHMEDFINGKGFIAEMTPQEYLHRISYDVFHSSYSYTARGVDTDRVQLYAKMMKNGVKFDMPLMVTDEGQEGRHRAMAAYLAGIQKIPVYVRRKGNK